MATSQVHAVKTALVSTLTALWPKPVWVGYGHPGTLRVDDMIAVMDATAQQVGGPMGGPRVREESISAQLLFSVFRGGNDQATVTARAFALLAALETSLRTDPTLGITGARLGQVTAIDLAEEAQTSGRVTELAVTVQIVVRLA